MGHAIMNIRIGAKRKQCTSTVNIIALHCCSFYERVFFIANA